MTFSLLASEEVTVSRCSPNRPRKLLQSVPGVIRQSLVAVAPPKVLHVQPILHISHLLRQKWVDSGTAKIKYKPNAGPEPAE